MPPPDGRLTAELRHKSENAHRRSRLLRGVGRVVPMCAVLQADHASVQVCATHRSPEAARGQGGASPFSPFPCLRLGGSSSARLGEYAVVAQSVEQPREGVRRFNPGQRKHPAPEASYGCRKERRPACRLEAGGAASPPDKNAP